MTRPLNKLHCTPPASVYAVMLLPLQPDTSSSSKATSTSTCQAARQRRPAAVTSSRGTQWTHTPRRRPAARAGTRRPPLSPLRRTRRAAMARSSLGRRPCLPALKGCKSCGPDISRLCFCEALGTWMSRRAVAQGRRLCAHCTLRKLLGSFRASKANTSDHWKGCFCRLCNVHGNTSSVHKHSVGESRSGVRAASCGMSLQQL